MAEGDPIGAAIICTREPDDLVGEVELNWPKPQRGFLPSKWKSDVITELAVLILVEFVSGLTTGYGGTWCHLSFIIWGNVR